jgi:hypothetical protein
MYRIVVLFLFSFLAVACDPAYHLSYAVVNESQSPVYCVDSKGTFMKGSVFRVDPDSSVMVYEEAGFGSGKSQFKSSKSEVDNRFRFYSDSTCSDSSLINPRKEWKYHSLPKGDHNVRLYIRNSDLRK